MPKTMCTHTRLLFLGLLASLVSAGQAADSPFSLGSDSGLQIAVRLISDKTPEEPSADGSVEEESVEPPEQTEEGAPSAQTPGTPASQEDRVEDQGLSEGPEEGQPTAGQETAGETEDPGVEDELEREPELAEQASIEEGQERELSRIEAVLNRVDQILLDAGVRARKEREGRIDGDGTTEEDLPDWETQGEGEGEAAEEEAERGGVAEGQVPGDVPTGKTRPTHGYEKDDDIVTRQVCELAEREEDPEVRKQLEQKCKSLRDS